MRAIVLALKITEIQYVERANLECPVLLLDDVSSELDRLRTSSCSTSSAGGSQTFITTTHRDYIQIDDAERTFAVDAGGVGPIETGMGGEGS